LVFRRGDNSLPHYRSFVTLGRGKKEIRVRQEDKNGISKVINNGLK
jgi:hypothetical protein